MTEPVRHQELEGVSWHLTHGVPIPAGVTITARFVDGTVAGHAAVNRYRAQYQSERGGLSIGPGATTMMAGAPDAMAAERAYLTLLESVVAYRIGPDGRSLILSDRAGDDILWYVAAPDVSVALLGRWDVRFVRRESALGSPALSGTRPYLEFDGAGQVSGHGGVNRLHGTVRVDGDRLWLGPLASTRMAGPADAMESEDALLAALDHVAAFRIDGHALYLIDADGQTRVQLERPEGSR